MEAVLEQLRLMARSVWTRRWLVLAVSSVVAVLLGTIVWMVPNRYQAGARVYVDTQTVLKPLMVGLAYQPDIEQQVRMLARTLVSRPNVERMLETNDFGWDVRDLAARARLVNELLEKIKVEGGGSGNLYTVSFRDSNPERARRVVDAIVEMFMHSTTGEKRRDSQDASRFINDQIKEYEGKLVEAENRVKEFKVRNIGVTGGQSQDYFARMTSLSEQVNKLRIDLAAAEKSRDAYRHELSGEEPQIPAELTPNAPLPLPSEIDVRLEAQRKALDDLLRRYTDAHPDVIAARRIIGQLEAQKRSEAEAKSTPVGRRAAAATSPVYQRIRVALAEAEAQVASLRSQLSAQQAQLEQTRAVASRVPQVESELSQLTRDYDVIRKNYELLVQRRESASLGVKLDESSQLADFRVIEPPLVAPNPVAPSRKQLGLLAILLSLASGVAVAVGLEMLRPTFREPKSLRLLTGRPVLGSVSMAMSSAGMRGEVIRFTGGVLLLLAVQAVWLVMIALRPHS